MMAEKKIHLICNAHIDPIWQWGWDEGISAAIATFKSAADLSETHDFIFCHGESLLYEAIEEHAPELFERIKKLVKEGRWHITGGWYLQPDCLMPCGETFVRHHKVGSRYFKEKFGIDVKIATSYDAFGHSVGLAQILKKTGYEGYIVCRPWATQFDYPSRFFNWTGPDGSSIKTTQTFSYSSSLGKATKKILDTYDNVFVTFAGTGPDEAWIRAELDGYTNYEITKYASDDSLKVHADKHIAVVPSLGSEGTSLSLLEAMASGCAVVCTNVGGMTNIVIDGFNGIMADIAGDSLYYAIKKLVDDEELRKDIGKNAYDTVSKGFSYERWAKAWKTVLLEFFP